MSQTKFKVIENNNMDKENRNKAIFQATKHAIDIPLAIMEKSSELLTLMNELIKCTSITNVELIDE